VNSIKLGTEIYTGKPFKFDNNASSMNNHTNTVLVKRAPVRDQITFNANQNKSTSKVVSLPAGKGQISSSQLNAYQEKFDHYIKMADLHNMVLYSFADTLRTAQALQDAQVNLNQTKEELYQGIRDEMFTAFGTLQDSPVIVVEGTDGKDFSTLDKKTYQHIKTIYLDILNRPEIIENVEFDTKKQKLLEGHEKTEIKEHIADLKHIMTDILPEILQTKKIAMQDPSDLQKLFEDEVIGSLILEKLHQEYPGEEYDPFDQKFLDEKGLDYKPIPEQKFDNALEIIKAISNKFEITLVSKVPERFYDPLGNEQKRVHSPDNYYEKKLLGLRHKPKNFYEAAYLKNKIEKMSGVSPASVVVVTPRHAASTVVEKVKAMNKDYLFIEDWLYNYCLGDHKEKQKILNDIQKTTEGNTPLNLKELASDLDNYVGNFVKIYDISDSKNNPRLNDAMNEFGKVTAMSEISRGYFLNVEDESKDLIKLLSVMGLFAIATDGMGEGTLIGSGKNMVMGAGDNVFDACASYMLWKQQFGEDKAKDMLQSTIAHTLTLALPTMVMQLSPDAGPLQHLLYSNATAGSVYSIVIQSFVRYYDKLEELIDKGVKHIPSEIKDNPDEVARWKFTETWRAYAGHALNRGEFLGLLVTQPMALAAKPMMQIAAPIGGKSVVVALEGSMEILAAHGYVLMDPIFWNSFNNKVKKQLLTEPEKKMTAEHFVEMRKSSMTKVIESRMGQATIAGGVQAKKHFPSQLAQGVKKAYMSVFGVVSKALAKPITDVSVKVMEMKDQKKHAHKDHENHLPPRDLAKEAA
jgi:hypothetical protein